MRSDPGMPQFNGAWATELRMISAYHPTPFVVPILQACDELLEKLLRPEQPLFKDTSETDMRNKFCYYFCNLDCCGHPLAREPGKPTKHLRTLKDVLEKYDIFVSYEHRTPVGAQTSDWVTPMSRGRVDMIIWVRHREDDSARDCQPTVPKLLRNRRELEYEIQHGGLTCAAILEFKLQDKKTDARSQVESYASRIQQHTCVGRVQSVMTVEVAKDAPKRPDQARTYDREFGVPMQPSSQKKQKKRSANPLASDTDTDASHPSKKR